MAVKDNLKGVPTSSCNRAYHLLYLLGSPIQRVFIVTAGKIKTVHFTCGAKPRDLIEFLCTFNSRGGGYQDSSRGNTGSAAEMGAYYWFDGTITTICELHPGFQCKILTLRQYAQSCSCSWSICHSNFCWGNQHSWNYHFQVCP